MNWYYFGMAMIVTCCLIPLIIGGIEDEIRIRKARRQRELDRLNER